MSRRHSNAKLQSLTASGLTLTEIGEELGLSVNGARAALRRRGLRATHSMRQSLRQKAENMRPSEAVAFLLDQIDLLTDGRASDTDHEVDGLGIHLTPATRRILIALWDKAGRVVSRDRLLTAMHFGRDCEEPQIKIVDVQICKLRKVLPSNVGYIETAWGVGFRFQHAVGRIDTGRITHEGEA